jgi:hypothetical protein
MVTCWFWYETGVTEAGAAGAAAGTAVADVEALAPAALLVTTLKVYVVPLLKPVKVHVRLRVLMQAFGTVMPVEGARATVYPMMDDPPSKLGTVQLTVEVPLWYEVALTEAGAFATV